MNRQHLWIILPALALTALYAIAAGMKISSSDSIICFGTNSIPTRSTNEFVFGSANDLYTFPGSLAVSGTNSFRYTQGDSAIVRPVLDSVQGTIATTIAPPFGTDFHMMDLTLDYTGTSGVNAGMYPFESVARIDTATDVGTATGGMFEVQHNGAGTLTTGRGVWILNQLLSAGTITSLDGLSVGNCNIQGTVNNLNQIHVNTSDSQSIAGKVTNYTGIAIGTPALSGSGNAINSYGIKIDAQSIGTNANYGIWVDAPTGGAGDNIAGYFDGSVRIGTNKLFFNSSANYIRETTGNYLLHKGALIGEDSDTQYQYYSGGTDANGSYILMYGKSHATLPSRMDLKAQSRFFFDTANVGIGTNAPAEKLEVAGSVKATGYKSWDGAATSIGITTIWTNLIPGVITQRIASVNGLICTNETISY